MLEIDLSPSEFLAKYGFTFETYFIQACKAGDVDTLRALHDRGVSANCFDSNSHTPLIAATYSRQTRVVRFLLSRKADPNRPERYSGGTPLHKAAAYNSTDIMALLLAHKADASIPNKPPQRDTPLHVAVQNNHTECVKLLLRAGASPYTRNDAGLSAYALAQSIDSALITVVAQELLNRRLYVSEYDDSRSDDEGKSPASSPSASLGEGS